MPDVDGWEVSCRLRAQGEFKAIPVVVVTGKSQDIDRALGSYVAAVDDCLVKPLGGEQLVSNVERVLSRTRNPSDS